MSGEKKVAIITNDLACDFHAKYRARIEKYFLDNSWDVREDYDVDLVVITTCGATSGAFFILEQVLKHLHDITFPSSRTVILGCLPKTLKARLAEIYDGNVVVFGNEHQMDAIVDAAVPFDSVESANVFKAPGQKHALDRNEPFLIEIAEGCLGECTFCVINRAHGFIKSKSLQNIAEQYQTAIHLGYRHICLFGTDTLAYGHDTGTNVIELIETLLRIEPSTRFALSGLHTRWLAKYHEGLAMLCRQGAVSALHPALQHVDDYILKRMGRTTTFAVVYDIIKNIKKESPDVFMATDIIVGFPGETSEIFQRLMEFCRDDRCIDRFNIFLFDDLAEAPSYKLDKKIGMAVKTLRYNVLRKVLAERNRNIPLFEEQCCKHLSTRSKMILSSLKAFFFCKNSYEKV